MRQEVNFKVYLNFAPYELYPSTPTLMQRRSSRSMKANLELVRRIYHGLAVLEVLAVLVFSNNLLDANVVQELPLCLTHGVGEELHGRPHRGGAVHPRGASALERRCGLLALALEWRCPPLEKTIDLRLDAAKYAVLEPCIALDTCLAQCILLTLPPDGLEIFHLPAEVGRDRRHLEMAKILTLGLFIGKSIFGTFWYFPPLAVYPQGIYFPNRAIPYSLLVFARTFGICPRVAVCPQGIYFPNRAIPYSLLPHTHEA